MQKINYFELLEEISVLSTRSVYLATENTRSRLQEALLECIELQAEATSKICTLEEFLFKDFLPPLERRSIAEAAHGMGRIIECSYQAISKKLQRSGYDKRSRDQDSYIKLAELIEESIKLLKKIKKPNQMPKSKEFRDILQKAHVVTKSSSKKQSSSALCMTELQKELSDCFDKIIEIMLCNI